MISTFNLVLLAASGLASLLGCVVSQWLLPKPPFVPPWFAAGRVAAATAVLSATVWVALLLALKISFPRIELELPWEAVTESTAIVVAGCFATLSIAAFGGRSVRNAALAGSLICAAVSCAAFATMGVIAAPSALAYDLTRVVVAMAVSSALFAGGIWLRSRGPPGARHFLPAAMMAVALVALSIASLASILPFSEWTVEVATPGALAFRPVTVVFLSELAVTFVFAILGAVVDRQTAAQAARENERLRQLSDSTFEALLIHREGRIIDANSAFCELTGRPLESVRGQPMASFVPGWDRPAPVSPVTGRSEAIETEIVGAAGEPLPVEFLSRDIPYADGTARVTALRDIRERRIAEARIQFLAQHDSLTGLPNRSQLRDVMRRQLALMQRDGIPVAVFYIDLDRFKTVNDTLGHQAGDLLLKQVAERILGSIRESDTLARVGGDEFILLQTAVPQPESAAQLATRLIEMLAKPFDLDGHQASIGVSIGIATGPQDGRQADELMKNADTALYRAKTSGRGLFRFFKLGMDTLLHQRLEMEQDIKRAVAAGEFDLAFQPIFGGDLADQIVGFEALLRWPDVERGPISPAEFIPLAEETGLIVPLGAWVLETACSEAASWPAPYRVAVNISPRQLASSDFSTSVAGALTRTGLAPGRLELEITEAVLIKGGEGAIRMLQRLKQLGVRIALDNFGSGYSSVASLQRVRFDNLKIDQSFVQSLTDSEDSRAVVGATLAMCRHLHLDVTAAGVESKDQLSQLLAQHCDQVQGFLLGQPIPRQDVAGYLARKKTEAGIVPPQGASGIRQYEPAGGGTSVRLARWSPQEAPMTRTHTEETVEKTDGQQNTGNHKKPGAPDAKGADTFGGTRAGAENVEHPGGDAAPPAT